MYVIVRLITLVLFVLFLGFSPTLAQSPSDDLFRAQEVRVTGVLEPIYESDQIHAQLVQADTLVKAAAARAKYGYTGSGYAVAIIDTGVDYSHSALGGGLGNRVIAGYDFVNGDNDPMDDHGHGTHAAGIAAGNDATYKGIAPDANIVALKVLNSSGTGSFGNVESALQWVMTYRDTYNIVAINMSLGSGNYSTNPSNVLEDEFAALVAAGVTICVSSGNAFYSNASTQGLSYPAVSAQVVSVGAVWDANVGSISWGDGAQDISTGVQRVTSFTQRNGNLKIVAPGALITAAYLGGGFGTLGGTSMSSPMVAGAAVIMHQALDDRGRSDLATQNRILQFFTDNGLSVTDGDDEDDNVTNTGLTFKSLNLEAAMDDLNAVAPAGAPTATPTVAPTATHTPTPVPTIIPTSPAVPTPVPTSTATPTPTARPVVRTPQQVSNLLDEFVDALRDIRGRLNESEGEVIEFLDELRELLRRSLLEGVSTTRTITVRLIKIDRVSTKLVRLGQIETPNKAKRKKIKIAIRTQSRNLSKLISSTKRGIEF